MKYVLRHVREKQNKVWDRVEGDLACEQTLDIDKHYVQMRLGFAQ